MNNQTKITIIISTTAAVSLLLVFFVILPQLSAISSSVGMIVENRVELTQVRSEIQSYQQAFVQLRQVEDGKAELAGLFPEYTEMVSLVELLETAVDSSGTGHELTIIDEREEKALLPNPKDFKPRTPLVAGLTGISEVPFELALSGNFRQLINFLKYQENLPIFTEFETLTLTANSQQIQDRVELRNTGIATAKLTGVFFISNSGTLFSTVSSPFSP